MREKPTQQRRPSTGKKKKKTNFFLKWIVYNNWWWSAHAWREKKLQSQTCTKKGHHHWWSPPVWSTKASWILAKPLHLRSRGVSSANGRDVLKTATPTASLRSTERAQFFFMTTPDCRSHNQRFKRWMNWATKFCLIPHLTSHQPTTTSTISTTCYRENASTTSRRQKMLSKSSLNPEAGIFMLQTYKLISHWQQYVELL